jgi:tetratricopeptide (TPR) repeat protein
MTTRPTAAARQLTLLLAAALLAGCSSAPRDVKKDGEPVAPLAAPRDTPARASPPAPLARFEDSQRTRAREAGRDGRWPDARLAWAAVLALQPGDDEALDGWAQAEQSVRSTAQDRARRAEQARARGDAETAMRLNLEALAHDPTLPGPAEALRALERDRAMRVRTQAFARAPSPPSSAEFEHAELLAAEGEIDAALAVLEPLARAPRADAALKRRVCELLLRVAQTQAPPSAARATVERCLRLLPQHAAALQRARALDAR